MPQHAVFPFKTAGLVLVFVCFGMRKPIVFEQKVAELYFLTIAHSCLKRHKQLYISTLTKMSYFGNFSAKSKVSQEKGCSESVKIKKFSVFSCIFLACNKVVCSMKILVKVLACLSFSDKEKSCK